MQETKKGTFKRKLGEIEVINPELSNIIIDSLIEKGFDVISEPKGDFQFPVGAKLSVYRTEVRQIEMPRCY